MGRDTDIYRLNSEKAKTFLHFNITNKTKFKEPFIKFLERREPISGKEIYEDICKKASSDINTILPSELFELTLWLSEINCEMQNSIDRTKFFEDNGIESLLKLHGLDAYGYMFQLGTFLDHFELEGLDEKDEGKNLKSSFFNNYIDYMILLMSKILKQQLNKSEYHFTDEELSELENITKKNKSFFKMSQIIDLEIEYLKKSWINYSDKDDIISFSKVTPEIQTIYQAEIYLSECIDMKKLISCVNTNILIVDSI